MIASTLLIGDQSLKHSSMGTLFDTIREHVTEGKYVIGNHASERLEERGIVEWQVIAALEDGVLVAELPDASPNPAVELRESLAFYAVWRLRGLWV